MANQTKKIKNPAVDEVALRAEGLTYGTTERGVCPRCRGGSSSEKSFVVSRGLGGKVWWTCFRANCDFRGSLMLGSGHGIGEMADGTSARSRSTRYFDRPIEELGDYAIKFFRSKFDFSPGNDIYYCPSLGRYAHRVYGPMGQNRGWVLKAYDGKEPKAIAYPQRDEPFISWSWPRFPQYSGVVVVEDLESARKVSDAGMKSVALLGTSMDFERAYEIAEQAKDSVVDGVKPAVILALDRGTMSTMLAYRRKYELIWGFTLIWQLDQDLKYVTRKRIKKAIENGESDFISLPE